MLLCILLYFGHLKLGRFFSAAAANVENNRRRGRRRRLRLALMEQFRSVHRHRNFYEHKVGKILACFMERRNFICGNKTLKKIYVFCKIRLGIKGIFVVINTPKK